MKMLVTDGADFIGLVVVRHIIHYTQDSVVNIDKLIYTGNLENLASVDGSGRYTFEQVNICDLDDLDRVFAIRKPGALMYLAAESLVERFIDGPSTFIETNIVGTYTLLESSRKCWAGLEPEQKECFCFYHISTDKVYGDLDGAEDLFTKKAPYTTPSSPYSAGKASSDHLVRAWGRTYGFPTVVTNCSNNYGPYHFPEKLIPLVILNSLEGKPLPIYGKGDQIRDWLYVEGHARALCRVVNEGQVGETYNIGGHNEKQNFQVVETICKLREELAQDTPNSKSSGKASGFASLIAYVKNRPGHDVRYAIDASKIQRELDWILEESFESGIRKTVPWYLNNLEWAQRVQDGSCQRERLGAKV